MTLVPARKRLALGCFVLMAAACLVGSPARAVAQVATPSAIIEAKGFVFPQNAPVDREDVVGDLLVRGGLIVRPAGWLRIETGLDLRANSHDQVEDDWRLDWEDRSARRPRASVRRLSAGISAGAFSIDVGKQFIRWGRADVIYPTDRFAPRDYLNVIESEILPVLGAQAAVRFGDETLEAVFTPRLTPTRTPLLDQRWSFLPDAATLLAVKDAGADVPDGSQYGVRWRHTGGRLETAVQYFDGFNHLPDIRARVDATSLALQRVHPRIQMFGADAAVPTPWLTFKLEGAYVNAPREDTTEYFLYVIEIERQIGEWLLDVGYADDVVTEERGTVAFAPDRGMAQSFIGRAMYTVDPSRSVAFETAVRQEGDGVYWKMEYSQALGRFVRLTLSATALGGDEGNFLGHYRRNSHAAATFRINF